MKIELSFAKWGQALRVAFLIMVLLLLQAIIIRESIEFGAELVIYELKQQQTERTGISLPNTATSIGAVWLTNEYS